MGEMLGTLLLVGLASATVLAVRAVHRYRESWWRKAFVAAGVTDITTDTFAGMVTEIAGKADGLDVRIKSYSRGKHENGTRIVIGGLRHGPYGLTLRGEGFSSAVEKAFGEREIEVGDPAFDDAVYIQGAPSLVRALFDPETRRLLRPLIEGRLDVEGPEGPRQLKGLRVIVAQGELSVDIRTSPFGRTSRLLPAVLPVLVAAARRLKARGDLAGRIAANTRTEPWAGVRLANLKALTTEFRIHPATRQIVLALLADDDPEVRLQAALAAGDDGRATLTGLATGPASDAIASKAVAALGASLGVPRIIERLGLAREAGHASTARACLEALGACQEDAALAALVETLGAVDPVQAAVAARALGAVGRPEGEGPLVEALGRESSEVREAAAEALGRVGTTLSVVPLRSAASAHPLDGAFRRAARQAIVGIQSRVTGASPGQLSLAGDEAGALSLADDVATGQLSLAQPTAASQADRAEEVNARERAAAHERARRQAQ